MKVCRMDCPYCGASIEADVENRKIVYCTYCGKQIRIENDSSNITVNQNININQNINQRVTNDAEILKEQNRHRENRWVLIIASIILLILVGGISILFIRRNSNTTVETSTNVKDEIVEQAEKKEEIPTAQKEDPLVVQQEEKKEPENQPTSNEVVSQNDSTSSNDQDKQSIELVESGYSVTASNDSEYVDIYYAVKILNPNKEYAVRYPKLRITARAADGTILTTDEQRIRLIEAGESIIFACNTLYEGKRADSVEISVSDEGTYFQHNGSNLAYQKQLVVSNTSVNNASHKRTFTGEVKNNSDVDLDAVFIAVVFKNKGKMIGGEYGFIHKLKSGDTLPFEVTDWSDIEYDSYEVYGLQWPD